MAEVYLRVANVFDAGAIADIKNYYIENTDIIFTSEKVTNEKIAFEIDRKDISYVVAESNGAIIGYASLSDYRSGGYYISKEVSVYLDQSSIGVGVGHALLEAIITQGKLLGLSTLVAYINKKNTKSLTLFKRNGFEECGSLHNVAYKYDHYLDVSILQIQLK